MAKSTPAKPDHLYLVRKKVKPHDLRQDKAGRLIVAVQNRDGALRNIQSIDRNGDKLFLFQGEVTGNYAVIARPDWATQRPLAIIVCEGWATGASLHEATGRAVIVAFDAGNLRPVAEMFRERYADAIIVIAGDDDRWKPEKGNTGAKKAREAADAVAGTMAIVDVSGIPGKPTDFNDVHVARGMEEVRRQIDVALQAHRPKPASPLADQECDENPPIPELPAFRVPTMDGETAGRRLRRTMRAFFDRLELHFKALYWRDARRAELEAEAADRIEQMAEEDRERALGKIKARATRDAKRKFGKAMKKPRYQIVGAAGVGKTRAFAEEYRTRPALWSRHFWYFAPTVRLCEMFAEVVNADAPTGMPPVRVMPGRTYRADDRPPLCQRYKIVDKAKNSVGSVYKSFCDDNEGHRCSFYSECAYIRQQLDRAPAIRCFPHASLSTSQAQEMAPAKADFVLVDESCVAALTKFAKVDPELFSDVSTYHLPDAGAATINDAHEHAALGNRVINLIRGCDNFLQEIRKIYDADRREQISRIGTLAADAKDNPASLINRLIAAADAADQERPSTRIVPGDDDETVQQKLNAMVGNPGRRVAAVLRQIAKDLLSGREASIAIEWVGKSAVDDDDGDADEVKFEPRVFSHGLKFLSFPEGVPLLLIDADADLEFNNRLFSRGGNTPPLRSITISAKRRGRFTQCKSSAFPKKHLIPVQLDAEAHPGTTKVVTRAKNERDKILALAQELASGGNRVLIVTNKPVRRALTGEQDNKLVLSFKISDGVEIAHFGSILGQNRWHDFDAVLIVGREQPSARSVERMARAIYADDPKVSLNLTGEYVKMRRRYGVGCDQKADIQAHPDPHVQKVLELVRERQTCQAIDRIRLMYPDKREPEIIIMCNIPVPGIVPDRLASAKNIYAGGPRLEQAAKSGLFTENAAVLAKLYRNLWRTEKAAEHDIQRAKSETPKMHKESILYAKWGFLISGEFRRSCPGSRHWSTFSYDPKPYRRPDILIARAAGASHIDEIEYRGHAAAALQRRRAMDERMGRMPSLAPHQGVVKLGSREFWENEFAMRPARVTLRAPDGTVIERWRDYAGRFIPRPIDAPRAPRPAPPPDNHVYPGLARIRDLDAAGNVVSEEWRNIRTGGRVAPPAGTASPPRAVP